MKIKMLETRMGSEDGFGVKKFHEGQVYDMRDSLASDFLRKGFCVATDESCVVFSEAK